MITRSHRFHGYGSLKTVYRFGAVNRSSFFSLKFLKNPKRKAYRAAVVVSRKVHKSAIVRNRIRRRLYEALRSLEAEIIQPYDIVITIHSDNILENDFNSIQKQLKDQLKKAGIL